MIKSPASPKPEQPRPKQPQEEDVFEPLILSPDMDDSGISTAPSEFVLMQTSFLDQAKQIEDRIKKEFPYYMPVLCLDTLAVAISIIVLGWSALLIPVCLLSAILAGTFARFMLNTIMQHYTATAYMIITVFNVYVFLERLLFSNAYDRSDPHHTLYIVNLALSSVLHGYIAVNARLIGKLLQERDILLAGFKLCANGRKFDLESHLTYVSDSSELHKNAIERVGQIEKRLKVEFSYFYHISFMLSVSLISVFLLLETQDPSAFKMSLLVFSGAVVGVYAGHKMHLLSQIYSFSVIVMFIFTSIICTFVLFLMMILGGAMNLSFAIFAFVAFTGVACKIAFDLWRVTSFMQERANLLANLARWNQYKVENSM